MSKRKNKAATSNPALANSLPTSHPVGQDSLSKILDTLKKHEALYFDVVTREYRAHNLAALENGQAEFKKLPRHTRDYLQDIFDRNSDFFGETYREFVYLLLSTLHRHEERLAIFKAGQLLLFVHSLHEFSKSRERLEQYANDKDAQSELLRQLELQYGEQKKALERYRRGLRFGPIIAGRKATERAAAARRDARQMFRDVLIHEPAWYASRIHEHIQARLPPQRYGYSTKKFSLRQILQWTSGLKKKFIAEKNAEI